MCESGNCSTCGENKTCNWEGRLHAEAPEINWRLIFSWESRDGTLLKHYNDSDWKMVADYFTHE